MSAGLMSPGSRGFPGSPTSRQTTFAGSHGGELPKVFAPPLEMAREERQQQERLDALRSEVMRLQREEDDIADRLERWTGEGASALVRTAMYAVQRALSRIVEVRDIATRANDAGAGFCEGAFEMLRGHCDFIHDALRQVYDAQEDHLGGQTQREAQLRKLAKLREERAARLTDWRTLCTDALRRHAARSAAATEVHTAVLHYAREVVRERKAWLLHSGPQEQQWGGGPFAARVAALLQLGQPHRICFGDGCDTVAEKFATRLRLRDWALRVGTPEEITLLQALLTQATLQQDGPPPDAGASAGEIANKHRRELIALETRWRCRTETWRTELGDLQLRCKGVRDALFALRRAMAEQLQGAKQQVGGVGADIHRTQLDRHMSLTKQIRHLQRSGRQLRKASTKGSVHSVCFGPQVEGDDDDAPVSVGGESARMDASATQEDAAAGHSPSFRPSPAVGSLLLARGMSHAASSGLLSVGGHGSARQLHPAKSSGSRLSSRLSPPHAGSQSDLGSAAPAEPTQLQGSLQPHPPSIPPPPMPPPMPVTDPAELSRAIIDRRNMYAAAIERQRIRLQQLAAHQDELWRSMEATASSMGSAPAAMGADGGEKAGSGGVRRGSAADAPKAPRPQTAPRGGVGLPKLSPHVPHTRPGTAVRHTPASAVAEGHPAEAREGGGLADVLHVLEA
eukprot:TRINITY_DN17562_c0_g1_i1.p1 TRINITY_DN17562_c0_g1~~TRINITY_DN17562_c0_g1_i1.p1  ORF type:complete len:708 (+),score=165.98 TRINITY_DN17562_c0_g1_i1:80-2125(+)